MTLALTKISETASKITLGWTPVTDAIGYRFQSAATAPKWSHTWDASRSQVTFAKANWYKVEALGVEDAGQYPSATPPPPPPSSAYFIEDWSTGRAETARWDRYHSYSSPGWFNTPVAASPDGRVAVVNDPAGGSGKCVRVEIRDSDPDWASTPGIDKSEIASGASKTWNGSFTWGITRWFEWDIYLPYNATEKFEWAHGNDQPYFGFFGLHPPGPTGWSAIHLGWEAYQFNSGGDSYQDRNVRLNFRIEGGTWNNGGPNPYDATYNLLPLTDGNGNRVLANHNRWIHLVWGMKFHYDSSGWFEAWVDGQNVIPRVSRPTSWNTDGQNYFKYGLYRRSGNTFPESGRSVAYFGRTTIGNDRPF